MINLLQIIGFFLIGFFELLLGTIDFKFIQKNRIALTGLAEIIHVFFWAYIIYNLFITGIFYLDHVASYALGCSLGKMTALKYEPIIDRYILKVTRKGRKVKRGSWQGKRK